MAMEIIAWLGFSHGLFAALIMLAIKKQSVSDKILTAWLTLLAIEFLTFAIDIRTFGISMLSSSFLLFNPAFYLYSKTLIGRKFKLKKIQLLHLLPFVFFEVFAYIIQEPYKLSSFLERDNTIWFRLSFALASVLSWIAYNWATFHLIFRHRRKLKDEFSNLGTNNRAGWLVFVVVFYNLYCLVAMALASYAIISKIDLPVSPAYNYSALLLLIYILSFYGIKQKEIYGFIYNDSETEQSPKNKSLLSNTQKEMIKTRLLQFFNQEQPYLNPELNMHILSEKLQIPKHQLTEVLNSVIGKNFFSFVNEYRVNAVKNMLKSKPHYSIEAIGYECGFNSKSSFFTVFRKITGYTPMQFKSLH